MIVGRAAALFVFVGMVLSEDGKYCKLYKMSDELQVSCITLMCCYLILCTAGSEQNHTVLLSNTYTEYRLDLSDLHLVTVQLQTVVKQN